MEDDGRSLIFAKVTNPNIIKVVAKSLCIIDPPNYSNCIVDEEPKIIVRSRKLTELG
jgi:hypothetical protein